MDSIDHWAECLAISMLVDAEKSPAADGTIILKHDTPARFQRGTFTMFGIRFVRRPLAVGKAGWIVESGNRELAQRWKDDHPRLPPLKMLPFDRQTYEKDLRSADEYRYHLAQTYLACGNAAAACKEWLCLSRKFPTVAKMALCVLIDAARKDWLGVQIVAGHLCQEEPLNRKWPLLQAYAGRHQGCSAWGRRLLEVAMLQFPMVADLQSNLACYACRDRIGIGPTPAPHQWPAPSAGSENALVP